MPCQQATAPTTGRTCGAMTGPVILSVWLSLLFLFRRCDIQMFSGPCFLLQTRPASSQRLVIQTCKANIPAGGRRLFAQCFFNFFPSAGNCQSQDRFIDLFRGSANAMIWPIRRSKIYNVILTLGFSDAKVVFGCSRGNKDACTQGVLTFTYALIHAVVTVVWFHPVPEPFWSCRRLGQCLGFWVWDCDYDLGRENKQSRQGFARMVVVFWNVGWKLMEVGRPPLAPV